MWIIKFQSHMYIIICLKSNIFKIKNDFQYKFK